MHKLLFHPQAAKNLKRMHPVDRKRLLKKIEALSKNPQDKNLDIRKLANTKKGYRLRSGSVRAIFEIDEKIKTIYIWDINYRGSIY